VYLKAARGDFLSAKIRFRRQTKEGKVLMSVAVGVDVGVAAEYIAGSDAPGFLSARAIGVP
jgi:hypothetical protein